MKKYNTIIVFSEDNQSKGVYQSLASDGSTQVLFKDRSKSNLASLLEQKIDLIFIEIAKPVMSEIDFVDQIYSLNPQIPIVLSSAYFYDTRTIVFGNKIQDFIYVPITVEKIQTVTNRLLTKGLTVEQPTEPTKEKISEVLNEAKKLSVLFEISKSLNSITNFDELLAHIIKLAAETLNAERSTLFLVDKENKELWARTGIGIKQKEIRIPMDSGIAGEVVTSGLSQIIDDPYTHPKFNKNVDSKTGFKTRNILCLPMKNLAGEIIGVFQILNKKSGQFTKDDEIFLSAMAASTGIAIENSLLHEQLKKQLQDVKTSYDELFIAQNQIVKEAKFSTISEMTGHIKNEILNDDKITSIVNDLQKDYSFDPKIKKATKEILDIFKSKTKSIDAFIEARKKEIFK
jgi:putative methionine-R-sulfoxide reductase with GAF domain